MSELEVEPYDPNPGEIAGVDICGWKTEDGIIIGSDLNGPKMKEFPPKVRVAGMIYTLEEVKWQENGFGWGVYV